MVQKEVAQRIVADQESDDYGALSVLFGLFTEAKIQFDVSNNCFYPPPKITSSVLTIQRESLIDQETRFHAFEISKVAFQQRRKKVRTSLSSIITEKQLEGLDIDINSRAGNLSPNDYLKIAKARLQ
jgi:16S rRNA (adenine1518-N6/adenine1519-N6)-dimethyltransferase